MDKIHNLSNSQTASDTEDLIYDLQSLIRQRSISSKNEGLNECADLVLKMMQRSGIDSQLLRLNKGNQNVPPPLIYGQVRSKSNPQGKTILFYNHYDVQPVEPLSLWKYDPFGGDIVGGKIFGRGSSDDKGELLTRIKAVERLLRQTGDVPCNIKFVIEGEEEIGSPHLRQYLQEYSRHFSCNAMIWEFGYIDSELRPFINLGMKGMLYVEMICHGPSTDLHSSLAVLVENPVWKMVKALNSILDDKNANILIKDWYKEAREFTAEENAFMMQQPAYDIQQLKMRYGLRRLLKDFDQNELKLSLAGRPTCNISSIDTGYIIQGAKTVIPSMVRVKMDFRLIPNMVPEIQFQRLISHLRDNGLDDIKVKFIHGIPAARTSFKDPFVGIVKAAAEKVFRKGPILNLSSAGSGPMSLFVDSLKCPCIAAGCTSILSNIHGPNEFADISMLMKGISFIVQIIQDFSSKTRHIN